MIKVAGNVIVQQAILPDELTLGVRVYSDCGGDGCNDDQGGCDSDASCGQDC